nr:14929_t:CDS:2 [Entrophospora candida]
MNAQRNNVEGTSGPTSKGLDQFLEFPNSTFFVPEDTAVNIKPEKAIRTTDPNAFYAYQKKENELVKKAKNNGTFWIRILVAYPAKIQQKSYWRSIDNRCTGTHVSELMIIIDNEAKHFFKQEELNILNALKKHKAEYITFRENGLPVTKDTNPSNNSSQNSIKSTEKPIGRRVSGKPWKYQKTATRRSQLPKVLRKSWTERMKEKNERIAVKLLENELKDKVESEKKRKQEARLKRKQALEEKERLERLATMYSVKKLQRLKKRKGLRK